MKKHVLFIHGAGEGAYEEDALMVEALQNALGLTYNVQYPKMPTEDSATYKDWKASIETALATLEDTIMLVGHSVGGSVLLKYLSEGQVAKPITGVFAIASPYWGVDDFWKWDEATLPQDAAAKLSYIPRIFLYHSRDDEIVPFSHLTRYASLLPQATVRVLDGRGHQFGNDMVEVAEDITNAATTSG